MPYIPSIKSCSMLIEPVEAIIDTIVEKPSLKNLWKTSVQPVMGRAYAVKTKDGYKLICRTRHELIVNTMAHFQA